jgi:hypothetical protein
MTGLRSRFAAWLDSRSEEDQQRVRAAKNGRIPDDLARSLAEAGIIPGFREWDEAPDSRFYLLPPEVLDYLDELDRGDEQG